MDMRESGHPNQITILKFPNFSKGESALKDFAMMTNLQDCCTGISPHVAIAEELYLFSIWKGTLFMQKGVCVCV